MIDNEIIKTSNEIPTLSGKIKAIYPHIVVTGSPLQPYYSIEWYDVEKGEMIHGYSSFSLPIVFKWLKEDFEVIDNDIDHFINTKKEEIKRHEANLKEAFEEIEALKQENLHNKVESVKEFVDLLSEDLTLLAKHEDEFRRSVILGIVHTINSKYKSWESKQK